MSMPIKFHDKNSKKAKGSKHGLTKLNENQVRDIKKLNHMIGTKVAAIYGVNPSVIRDIRRGRTWQHVKQN